MTIIDLTHRITNQIKEFPGDPKTNLKNVENTECIISKLEMSVHTGTHMDAPLHYFYQKDIADYNLEDFIGKACVINSDSEIINPDIMPLEEIVIINTGSSKNWGKSNYFVDYPYLSIEFTERLIEENVKGVAIDTCSVDKIDEDKIHKLLLKNNIWIVENIANSDKLKKECYNSYFIPLKIEVEGSPVRAFVED